MMQGWDSRKSPQRTPISLPGPRNTGDQPLQLHRQSLLAPPLQAPQSGANRVNRVSHEYDETNQLTNTSHFLQKRSQDTGPFVGIQHKCTTCRCDTSKRDWNQQNSQRQYENPEPKVVNHMFEDEEEEEEEDRLNYYGPDRFTSQDHSQPQHDRRRRHFGQPQPPMTAISTPQRQRENNGFDLSGRPAPTPTRYTTDRRTSEHPMQTLSLARPPPPPPPTPPPPPPPYDNRGRKYDRTPWHTSPDGTFNLIVIGPPSSGKSHFIRNLVQGPLYEKYNYIWYFSPNDIFEGDGICQKGINWFVKPSLSIIHEIISSCLHTHPEADRMSPITMLFIFDDCAGSITDSDDWYDLFSCRRHLEDDRVKASFIISCHKLKGVIRPKIRIVTDGLVCFEPGLVGPEVFNTLGIARSIQNTLSNFINSEDHEFLYISLRECTIAQGWSNVLCRIAYR
jgi:hypothetical protein